jgi:hypothetical protein
LRANYSKTMGPTFGVEHYAHYVEHSFKLDTVTGRYVFAYDPGNVTCVFQSLPFIT